MAEYNANLDMFPTLKQLIESNTTQMRKGVKIYLLSHLSFLKFHFQDYISDAEIKTFDWNRTHSPLN